MSTRTQRLFAWSGPIFVVTLLLGFVIANLIPPPSPNQSTAEITGFYRADADRIRLGLQIAVFGAALFLPFTVALFQQMRRIEGRPASWAYLQLATGTAGMFILMLPMIILQAALFRIDDIDPGTLQALSDFAWILFVSPAALFCLQTLAVGAVILGDQHSAPTFPRWVGYVCLWVAVTSALGFTVPFFKTGPLAWTGVLTYWTALTAFTTFVVMMSVMMLRALKVESASPPREPAIE